MSNKGFARILLAAGALCLATPCAFACSCMPVADRSFMTSAPKAPLVVHAKVVRHTEKRGDIYLAMDLEILEVLQGATTEKGLRVWGDNGSLCRPYVMKFPEQSEWVFALFREGDKWAIPVCRENWLRVVGGRRVRGMVEGGSIGEIGIDELDAMLKRR